MIATKYAHLVSEGTKAKILHLFREEEMEIPEIVRETKTSSNVIIEVLEIKFKELIENHADGICVLFFEDRQTSEGIAEKLRLRHSDVSHVILERSKEREEHGGLMKVGRAFMALQPAEKAMALEHSDDRYSEFIYKQMAEVYIKPSVILHWLKEHADIGPIKSKELNTQTFRMIGDAEGTMAHLAVHGYSKENLACIYDIEELRARAQYLMDYVQFAVESYYEAIEED